MRKRESPRKYTKASRNFAKSFVFFRGLPFLILLLATWHPIHAQLRVGIVGDQTGATDLDEAYRILEKGIEKLRQRGRFDVFLHTGDLLENSRPEDQVRKDFQRAVGLLNNLPGPWHMTPGDHDVNPPFKPGLQPDRSRQELFRRLYSEIQPQARERLFYSLDVKGYHFVALDSVEHLRTDPRWGNVFRARLSEEQIQWLEADLKRHRRSRGIILFTHQPLWYNWGSWERVHRLLSRYPVRAVIAGHFHYSQRDALLDGIQYLVVGATGGRIKNASPSAGGVQAVYELTVQGREVDLKVLPVSDAESFAPPSRHDMDRVQAVASALDLLDGFAAANPVYWQDGQPVASCGQAEAARLTLRQTGNPIDLPLLIELRVESDQVQLADSRFAPGACLDGAQSLECRLRPGFNIGLSNTSSVELNLISPVTIWEATLAARNEARLSQKIRLSLQMGFSGQSGEVMRLQRTLEMNIRICGAH